MADRAQNYHHSTAVEGNARVQRRYTIEGRFDPDTYLAFIEDRAKWLAIAGWATSPGPGIVQLVAAGPEALVGALEMACLLGPLDALIESVQMTGVAVADSAGFALR